METIELTKTAKRVLTVIDETGPESVNWNTIREITEMDHMSVVSGCLELELYGIIKQLPGKFFIRVDEAASFHTSIEKTAGFLNRKTMTD